jgi:Protein of unknown function (DUF1097)
MDATRDTAATSASRRHNAERSRARQIARTTAIAKRTCDTNPNCVKLSTSRSAPDITANAYGALVAWVALLIIVNVPVPGLGAIWPAIVVGVTVFFLVIVASIDLLSVVPANVYGYAALVAYSLHQPSAAPATGPLQNLVSPSFANPLVLLVVSMVIGALFGCASDQLAKVLPTKQPTMAAHV